MLIKMILMLFVFGSCFCVCAGEEGDSWDNNPAILESFKVLFATKKADGDSFRQMDPPYGILPNENEDLYGSFVSKLPESGQWGAYRKLDDFSGFFLVDQEANILAIYIHPFVVVNIYEERYKGDMDIADVKSAVDDVIVGFGDSDLKLREQNGENPIYTNTSPFYFGYDNDFRKSVIATAGDGYISIGFLAVRPDDSVHPRVNLQENKNWLEDMLSEPRSKPAVSDP